MSEPTAAPVAQVALVTGASRGIGKAIAAELARKAFRVIGTATTAAGAAAIGEALAAFPGCRGIVLDVTDGDALNAAIDAVVRETGFLHVLVNNAGITRDMLSMRMKDEDWNAVLATNLTAVFRASRAALRPMMKQRYGRIVNITSVVGSSGNPGQANYAAAKGAIATLTITLGREYERFGVTVNAIAPRARTRMTTSALGALEPEPGTFDSWAPENVAPVVVWLASDAAGEVSGQFFVVWGGAVHLVAPYQPAGSLQLDRAWTAEELIERQAELFAQRSSGLPVFPFGA